MRQNKAAVNGMLGWVCVGIVGAIALAGCGSGSQIAPDEQAKLPVDRPAASNAEYQKTKETVGRPGYPGGGQRPGYPGGSPNSSQGR